ncbi:MAG: LL-diaminopimelate aminotransferase [Clostridiales bacterium]|nr:LL-diaminopimelate aminotransferase [Clostridiales bacterium]
MKINENFLKLESSYLFSTVAKKQKEYQEKHPDKEVIRLSIGDVTKPLVPAVISAMHKAVDEMADESTFRGYPPEHGYDFILNAIQKNDYANLGIDIKTDEIFLSDGAKSDCGNIGDIFSVDNKVAICDPVYPVYLDTNVMNGRTDIIYLPCTAENGFMPQIPKDEIPDVIYLCFPNNPTGVTVSRKQLKEWVDFALKNNSLILYDAAYKAFIVDDSPKSIYEIDGAKKCAIEFCSFSKTAGFTGVRCGYTVVPKELVFNGQSLNPFWARRQATKFNGVSYITQRAAEAVYSEDGKKQTEDVIKYYQRNAKVIYDTLTNEGFKCFGAVNSPYVWMQTPNGMSSWEFFDDLLDNCQVVGTPGSGFGKSGEGYLRLTAFGNYEKTVEAVERIKSVYGKDK